MNVVLLQPKKSNTWYTVYWFTLYLCISLQTLTTNYIYYNYLIWNATMVTSHVSVISYVMSANQKTVEWSCVHYVVGKINILANENQRVRWQQTFPTNEISEYGYTLKMNETQWEYQNTMLNVNIGTETPDKHC